MDTQSDDPLAAALAEDEPEGEDARLEIVRQMHEDRELAHAFLFAHRHPLATPDFHKHIIWNWHDPSVPFYEAMAFREGAKSTIGEEATIIMALFGEFRNGLIVGATADKAAERLHAIKAEFENNDLITEIFGDVRNQSNWSESEIALRNGTRLLAVSKNTSLRGTKYEDSRPDYLFIDDLEDAEDVRSPEARKQRLLWFRNVLLPATARGNGSLVRMTATPLDRDCVAEVVSRDPEWVVGRYPAMYIDDNGMEQATWPESLSLERFKKLEASAMREGRLDSFRAEYMCQAEVEETKAFKPDQIVVEPRVRKWEPVYCMFDPARTAKATSATTGFAAWSWVNNRLIIWDSWGKLLLPDEIINAMFEAEDRFQPVFIGVEEDGLNEFILQPIRQEQVRRGVTLPIQALRAPKSKLDFIRGLQPYFASREARLACDQPDLRSQLTTFPSGKIDVPNALAYALKMHPGAPMYEEFAEHHIAEALQPSRQSELLLAMNATATEVSAVAFQVLDGAVRIYGSWVREGEPQIVTADLLAAVNRTLMRRVSVTTGPKHWDKYLNVGLNQALRAAKVEVRKGGDVHTGRAALSNLMQRQNRAGQMFAVSAEATWVLRGLSGGYSRTMDKQGRLSDEPPNNTYRTVMEGLESAAVLLRAPTYIAEGGDVSYAYTDNGRRYMSARR